MNHEHDHRRPASQLADLARRQPAAGGNRTSMRAVWRNGPGKAAPWWCAPAGQQTRLAWPLARRDVLLQRLTQQGLAWVYVDEQGWLKSGDLKQRALRRLHWPAQMSLALSR